MLEALQQRCVGPDFFLPTQFRGVTRTWIDDSLVYAPRLMFKVARTLPDNSVVMGRLRYDTIEETELAMAGRFPFDVLRVEETKPSSGARKFRYVSRRDRRSTEWVSGEGEWVG